MARKRLGREFNVADSEPLLKSRCARRSYEHQCEGTKVRISYSVSNRTLIIRPIRDVESPCIFAMADSIMKRKHWSEERVISTLKEHQIAASAREITRGHCGAKYVGNRWKSRYGGIAASDEIGSASWSGQTHAAEGSQPRKSRQLRITKTPPENMVNRLRSGLTALAKAYPWRCYAQRYGVPLSRGKALPPAGSGLIPFIQEEHL